METTKSLLTIVEVFRGPTRKRCKCICECGNVIEANLCDVRTLNTKSCGCLSRKPKKHGHCCNRKDSSMYKRWQHIKSRCLDKNNPRYNDYGGRGITICSEWLDFEVFLCDLGLPPEKHLQIDRIDNNKGYYKENVKWSTPKEQSNNRRKARRTRWDKD